MKDAEGPVKTESSHSATESKWHHRTQKSHSAFDILKVSDIRVESSPLVRLRTGRTDRSLPAIRVYGYANGVFSSRKLEQATYDSVVFRYLAAGSRQDRGCTSEPPENSVNHVPDSVPPRLYGFEIHRQGLLSPGTCNASCISAKPTHSRPW